MSTVAAAGRTASLDLIDVGENTRELDPSHVEALAASIALRGLIVPLVVRPDGVRFILVAGHHRYAACRSLGLTEVEVTLREQEGSSADSAAENVVRKQLSPLEEAHAVKNMLEEGYTLDGAAAVLGWSRNLVSARAKILELPEAGAAAARHRRAPRERRGRAREDQRRLTGALRGRARPGRQRRARAAASSRAIRDGRWATRCAKVTARPSPRT